MFENFFKEKFRKCDIEYGTTNARTKIGKNQKKTTKKCLRCGKQLTHGNQIFCLDCLLDDYETARYKTGAEMALFNRGLNKEMILQELEERKNER